MSNILNRIIKGIKNPKLIYKHILFACSSWLPDKFYLQQLFPIYTGYKLDLDNPQTYNEKLQWLKLYYRTPEQTKMVDKYAVKSYVNEKIGEAYTIATLGVWDSFDDIDFNLLPNKFVLKTTHDQGGVVVCIDKATFNYAQAKTKLTYHLKRNFYLKFREWPYKNVKPRIIAEEFIGDGEMDLKDYKFYCFNGKAKILFIASGRGGRQTNFDFYDIDFNHLDIKRPNTVQSKEGNKIPENYRKMVELAETLSGNFPHVRVDFYNLEGKIYFGELTFYTGSGMKPFYPKKWDYILGEYINLPYKKEMI